MIKKWIFASQKGRHSYLRQGDQKFAIWCTNREQSEDGAALQKIES